MNDRRLSPAIASETNLHRKLSGEKHHEKELSKQGLLSLNHSHECEVCWSRVMSGLCSVLDISRSSPNPWHFWGFSCSSPSLSSVRAFRRDVVRGEREVGPHELIQSWASGGPSGLALCLGGDAVSVVGAAIFALPVSSLQIVQVGHFSLCCV